MKQSIRLYNIILPIWLLWIFPQVWLILLPGNLIIDCAVLLITLLALRHTQKGAVLKRLWWKFWLLGFVADAAGVAWMLLGLLPAQWSDWWSDHIAYMMHHPFRSPVSFLWTLAGVAIAGVCIYFFDRRAMKSCDLLTGRERHSIALAMAIVTAPWLFFVSLY